MTSSDAWRRLEQLYEAALEVPSETRAAWLDLACDGDVQLRDEVVSLLEHDRELGRGGMGAVYLAARADEAFEKQVAVKLVKRGFDTEMVLERFSYERRILASLEHPYIARLLDAVRQNVNRE